MDLVPLIWEDGGPEALSWHGKSGETSNVSEKTRFQDFPICKTFKQNDLAVNWVKFNVGSSLERTLKDPHPLLYKSGPWFQGEIIFKKIVYNLYNYSTCLHMT